MISIIDAFEEVEGGEISVKKIPSMNIFEISAVVPQVKIEIVRIRPGEKLHEQMLGNQSAMYSHKHDEHYKIFSVIHNCSSSPLHIKNGARVADGFSYTSTNHQAWITQADLQEWKPLNQKKIGKIK